MMLFHSVNQLLCQLVYSGLIVEGSADDRPRHEGGLALDAAVFPGSGKTRSQHWGIFTSTGQPGGEGVLKVFFFAIKRGKVRCE
eukprot:CAMPEP_0194778068 /NCGR_PEP_ID=MMETSP0323_2-20130528/67290_1 /TAXON_ID=2866 ORGANISM="Crypthecodinium cohnii, Strain Seligo" /NCGR_SAMPLE_ID=MMETSP0323_2 /ASSEMBLY_ACC=CAM_ASM_000346 /LENGTH=83 /DNA_ID=CAMNT_0039715111 /DNA_START=110 /DNA_END=361 /DNA_ORIENTATION=-